MKWQRDHIIPGLFAAGLLIVGVAVTASAQSQTNDAWAGQGRRLRLSTWGALILAPYSCALIGVMLTNAAGARFWIIRGAAVAVALFGAALLIRSALGVKELAWGRDLLVRTLVPLPLGVFALCAYLTESDDAPDEPDEPSGDEP